MSFPHIKFDYINENAATLVHDYIIYILFNNDKKTCHSTLIHGGNDLSVCKFVLTGTSLSEYESLLLLIQGIEKIAFFYLLLFPK